MLPRSLIASGLKAAVWNDAVITDAMITRYLQLREGSRRATAIRFQTPRFHGDVNRLHEIMVPTLIMWGDRDTFVLPENAFKFKENIRDSRVVMYKDVGHLPMEEIPHRSAADAAAFLSGR